MNATTIDYSPALSALELATNTLRMFDNQDPATGLNPAQSAHTQSIRYRAVLSDAVHEYRRIRAGMNPASREYERVLYASAAFELALETFDSLHPSQDTTA